MANKDQSKFMQWYESYQGKHTINIIYSAGASVVIIGALFKIMHWPGAGIVLTIGMCTEAFLFMIGVLEKPHEEFHWANVFPQLLESGAPEERLEVAQKQARPTLLGMGAESGAVAESRQAGVNALSDKDMSALQNGMNELAKAATQLSELGKVAEATHNLSEKMDAAGAAAGQFASSADALCKKNEEIGVAYNAILNDMQGVAQSTKQYQQDVENMGQKLSAINSVYEMQLSAAQAQAEAMKGVAANADSMSKDIEKMQVAAAEAMKSQEAYEQGAKKLADQIADLNKVYGNMLNALA